MADPKDQGGDNKDRWKKAKQRAPWLSLLWTVYRIVREVYSHL